MLILMPAGMNFFPAVAIAIATLIVLAMHNNNYLKLLAISQNTVTLLIFQKSVASVLATYITITLTFSLIFTPSLVQTTPPLGTTAVSSTQDSTTCSLILTVSAELSSITA